MSSQNQGDSLSSFADIPMKRKHKQPCKGASVGGENIHPAPESYNPKSNKPSPWISDRASADMLGQMVSGVIERSFDAGYLVNVKIGETDTRLRGAVFQPGLFAPVTGANDVAPHAKMYKRKDIQGHPCVVSPSSRMVPGASGVKPGAWGVSDNRSASVLIPPASNSPMTAKFAATLPATETINPKPRVDLIPHELIHDDDAMSLDVGNRKTPETSELEPQATRSNMFSKQALSRQDTQSDLAQKITNGGANMSHMDGLSASDDVTTTATVVHEVDSSLMTATTYGMESDAEDVFRSSRF